MQKILATLCITALGAALTISAADASQGCGRGWHRNGHGYCVRDHHHRRMVMTPPPAYAPPTYTQTITAPARTGVIPGSANAAHQVCAYNYHPGPRGDCVPN